jgi:hypothetical protein
MENSMVIPQKKLQIELPYDPAIPLLGTYPKGMKSLYKKIFARPYLLQPCSQQLKYITNLDPHE